MRCYEEHRSAIHIALSFTDLYFGVRCKLRFGLGFCHCALVISGATVSTRTAIAHQLELQILCAQKCDQGDSPLRVLNVEGQEGMSLGKCWKSVVLNVSHLSYGFQIRRGRTKRGFEWEIPHQSRGKKGQTKRDKRSAVFLQIFAFPGNYSILEAQIFAGNRRFLQKTAGNRRFLQKPVCPI